MNHEPITIEQPDPINLVPNFILIDLALLVGVVSGALCLWGML